MKKLTILTVLALALPFHGISAAITPPASFTGKDFKGAALVVYHSGECTYDVFIKPDHSGGNFHFDYGNIQVGTKGGNTWRADLSGTGYPLSSSDILAFHSEYSMIGVRAKAYTNNDVITIITERGENPTDSRNCYLTEISNTNAGTSRIGISDNLYAGAEKSCSGISDKIDKIKIAAGISIGAGAVGTVAAGAATAAGIIDMKNNRADGAANDEAAARDIPADEQTAGEQPANVAGTVRTAGSFVAGGTAAIGAVSSFIGASQFDELIRDMNECTFVVKELDKQLTALRLESPEDSNIAKMDKIVKNCSGFNPGNIQNVKKAMIAAGVVSAVGAAAGIAGGATSVMANKQPEDSSDAESSETSATDGNAKNLGTASTILSGVAAAGAATSTILSGVVLSNLNKNGDIAKACNDAF